MEPIPHPHAPSPHKRPLREIRVLNGLLSRNTPSGIVNEEAVKQIQSVVAEALDVHPQVRARPLGERGFEVWLGGYAGPVDFGGGAEDSVGVLDGVAV